MCEQNICLATNSSCKFHENIQNIFHSLKENIFIWMTHRQCKRLYNIYYYLACPSITPVILYRYITPVVYKMVKRKSKTKNGLTFLILYYSFLCSLGRTFVPFPQEWVESLWNVSLTVRALSAHKHNTCYIYLLRKV